MLIHHPQPRHAQPAVGGGQSSSSHHHHDEEEEEPHSSSLREQAVLFPRGIIRPKAVKAISSAMHPQMVKDFERECQRAGIPSMAIQSAVYASQDWHRKWTFQEETNHTMPHQHDGWEEAMRQGGAKNPSPTDSPNSPGEEEEETAFPPFPQQPLQVLRPIPIRPTATTASSPLHLPVAPTLAPPTQQPQPQPCGETTLASASPLTLPSHEIHHPPKPQVPNHIYEEDCYSVESLTSSIPSFVLQRPRPTMESAKESVLHALAIHGGDVETPVFEEALKPLLEHYNATGWDARDPEGIYSHHSHTRKVEGMWLTLSKPTYFGNLGENPNGDPMYTLGRMAFDMFLPTQLVCSLQGNFNPVHVVPPQDRAALLDKCPKSLQEELDVGGTVLRTYNIVTAFTIEPHLADYPDAPNKDVRRPIKGIMTTYGYVLPDPACANRLSIWFTGGKIEPNDDEHDQREWKRFFSRGNLPPRSFGERVRVLAANLLMGAEVPKEMNSEDGSMEFEFTRPLGGHGVAYVDVVYMDDTMRIVRGHRGTIFVFARIPDPVC